MEKPKENNQRSNTAKSERKTLTLLTWDVPEEAAEHVSSVVDGIFPEGYEILDGSTLETPLPGRVLFRFYVSCNEAEDKIKLLSGLVLSSAHLGVLKEPGEISEELLADRDWSEETRKSFPPLEIGSFLFLPSWEAEKRDVNGANNASTGKALHVIELEPGPAFGTGHHPTTRLCLRALEHIDSELRSLNKSLPERILDLGCGSGILGLAAAFLWNARITAVDTDPDALESARENVTRNKLTDRFRVAGTEACADESFDLVTANIRASVLMELASKFNGWVKPGGAAILSGILAEEKETFFETWRKKAPSFVFISEFEEREDCSECPVGHSLGEPNTWICLVMGRKS